LILGSKITNWRIWILEMIHICSPKAGKMRKAKRMQKKPLSLKKSRRNYKLWRKKSKLTNREDWKN
jgi:hypothetical protein